MSLSPADALAVVAPLYPDPPWLARALVALAQVEAGTHDGGINVYAIGDDGRSAGAWQVHRLDWPREHAAVTASFALGEREALAQQANAIAPIVADALAELRAVPSWTEDDRAAALQAVWQLGAPGFRSVLEAAGPGASWLVPYGVLAAITSLYGQRLGEIAQSRVDRYQRFFRSLGGSYVSALQTGGVVVGLLLLIGLSLALGTKKGRQVTWAGTKATAATAKALL